MVEKPRNPYEEAIWLDAQLEPVEKLMLLGLLRKPADPDGWRQMTTTEWITLTGADQKTVRKHIRRLHEGYTRAKKGSEAIDVMPRLEQNIGYGGVRLWRLLYQIDTEPKENVIYITTWAKRFAEHYDPNEISGIIAKLRDVERFPPNYILSSLYALQRLTEKPDGQAPPMGAVYRWLHSHISRAVKAKEQRSAGAGT